jgi:hypothetical protein
MPEGICTKCGRKYAGWALKQPEYLICKCGGNIEIRSEIERARRERKRFTTPSRA